MIDFARTAVATAARQNAQSVGVDISNLLSGFVGAVIGAAITGFWADRTARRVQRNDRLHEQRAGARVIVIELVHNQNILEGFRKSGTWESDLVNRSFWESEGANVAEALTPEELVAVGEPYLYVQALDAVAATYAAGSNPKGMLSAKHERDILDLAVDGCGKAITVLRTYAGFSEAEFARLQKAASQ
jgi:uncharacterized membrane protein YeaQ/YmgE (transglycosylase-associated protein family)